MTYICTLLKELPDYPVGTTFVIEEHSDEEEYYCQFPEDDDGYYANYRIPRKVIDNPNWVKKTLDESCLTDLRCKNCGSTKLLLETYNVPSEYDDGVRYYKMGMRGVCSCGCTNEFIVFTTHTKVERW